MLEKTQKFLNMKILITLSDFEGQINKCHFLFLMFFLLFGFYYLSTSCPKVNFLWVTMRGQLFPILMLIFFVLHQLEWSLGTSPQTQPVWISKPGGRHKRLKS